jgi:hypothetical protein
MVNVMKPLEKEFGYFLSNQDELIKEYYNKYIVIKDQEVIGSYDNELEAIQETSKKYDLGTFLVQKCLPGINNYTQSYHSRVAFA